MKVLQPLPVRPAPRHPARRILMATAIMLLFAGTPGNVAAEEAPAQTPVDKAQREKIVAAVAGFVESNYVFPDQAVKIAKEIRVQNRKGAYNDIAHAEALVARLTGDMQAVTPDKHLKMMFSARARPMEDPTAEPSAEKKEQLRLEAASRNFGIERAEHLDGNVGYLKLTQFADPNLGGETLAAAMVFLANTDALIIDLRFNGGGRGDMGAMLTSYFIDGDPIRLADLYNRPSGETNQSWTLPFVPGPRYLGKPLYILTGERTFSAAEGFTYHMQKSGRAVVVGQQTRGGAHFVRVFQIDEHFFVMVPIGNVKDAVTGSNWEGVGITPEVAASSETAVRTAQRLALEKLLETAEGTRAERLKMLVGEMKAEAVNGSH